MNQPGTLPLSGRKPSKTVNLLLVLLAVGLAIGWPATPAQGAIPDSITLTVKQTFTTTGLSAPPSTVFTYRLTPSEPTNPLPPGSGSGAYNFTIKGTGDVPIGPFTFTQAGVYTYQLDHVTPNQTDYTYDQQSYTLKFYVDPDPSIPIGVVAFKQDTTKAMELAYEHTFGPALPMLEPSDPTQMVDPSVKKTVKGNPAKDGRFVFKLIAHDPTSPMPSGSSHGTKTLQITGPGEGEFGTWSYTDSGVYLYHVKEVNTGLAGYTYDTTIYTITDTVYEQNGQLVVDRQVTNHAGAAVSTMDFVNTYRKTVAPTRAPSPNPTQTPPDSPNQTPPDSPNQNANSPGRLPFTGTNLLQTLGAALTTLLAGWLLLAAKRRRRDS